MAGNVEVEITQDLIQQYVNITGSDEESALHLLEAFNGHLESAVNMYLEGGAPPVNHSSSSNNHPRAETTKNKNEKDNGNAPGTSTSTDPNKRYYKLSLINVKEDGMCGIQNTKNKIF